LEHNRQAKIKAETRRKRIVRISVKDEAAHLSLAPNKAFEKAARVEMYARFCATAAAAVAEVLASSAKTGA